MPRLSEDEARVLISRAFLQAGVSTLGIREAAASHLVLTEMMGIHTHGIARVSSYIARIRAGGIDPSAVPQAMHLAPALRLMDAKAALGVAVAQIALSEAMAAARSTGVAACFVRGATHFGAIAPCLWIAAEAGFASVITSNSAPMLAPPGGREVRVGNAPFGIGLPHGGGRHVMLDMALSVAARSKLRRAAECGEAIPDDWALDAEGRPTTDPEAALKGVLQAIGGSKGAALAVTLDLLAAGLSGAAMLSEVVDNHKEPGVVPNVGQLFILIDARAPDAAQGLDDRLDRAARIVAETPPVAGGPRQDCRARGQSPRSGARGRRAWSLRPTLGRIAGARRLTACMRMPIGPCVVRPRPRSSVISRMACRNCATSASVL
jgi:LDH2 family malate/lactate/ureidoglycolate dehydrogenase